MVATTLLLTSCGPRNLPRPQFNPIPDVTCKTAVGLMFDRPRQPQNPSQNAPASGLTDPTGAIIELECFHHVI